MRLKDNKKTTEPQWSIWQRFIVDIEISTVIVTAIVIGSTFFFQGAYAQENRRPTTIVTQNSDDKKDAYPVGLLKLALSYSDTRYNIDDLDEVITQSRQIEELKSGNLDVTWLGTSETLEDELRPIRIPIFKGFLGHRIFIIRKGEQTSFNRVRTLEDLKKIRLGQGKTWTDTTILKAAGLNLVTSLKFDGLFYMLEGGRFDAFPRGVHEPWSEVVSRRELDLTIEENLMVVYKYPLFFFVRKDNVKLGNTIEDGLRKAAEDGRFDEFFFNSPVIKTVLDNANMQKRRTFHIDNPTLTRATRAIPDKYWLDLSQLAP